MEIINLNFRLLMLLAFLVSASNINSFAYSFFVNGLAYDINPDNVTVSVSKNSWATGTIEIPSSVAYEGKSYTVTAISSSAFYECNRLAGVILPNTITCIGAHSFGRTGITDIEIPESVTKIEQWSFAACDRLKEIKIPNSVTHIGEGALCACDSLTTVILSNSIDKIEASTFGSCKRLKNISIPNSITEISRQAFQDCAELNDIIIPNSVESIGSNAFSGCIGLSSIIIPSSVNHISENAFWGCANLNWVIMMNSSPIYCQKNAFPDNQLIYVPNVQRYEVYWFGSIWTNYNLQSIYTLKNQITEAKLTSNNIFSLNAASLKDEEDHLLKNFNGIENSLIIDDLNPNTSYKISISIDLDDKELIFEDFFKTNDIEVSIIMPSSTNLTSIITTFNVSRDNGVSLDSCGVELDYSNSNSFLGFIKETSDGKYIIESEITGLIPNTIYNLRPWIAFKGVKYYGVTNSIRTARVSFSQYTLSSKTQTALIPSFYVNRDNGFILEACGVESNSSVYQGSIIETLDDYFIIECRLLGLVPNNSYNLRPWVQYKGQKYYGDYKTFQTLPVDISNNFIITPTSAFLSADYSSGDATVTKAYFTFNGEQYESLYQTGLNPGSRYYYTYTVETTNGNQVNDNYFNTPSLSMLAQPVKMLTNTTVMLEAQTNMIDDETMVGFEWRRYDAPSEMPSTLVYSPVFGGKIAGTLKNLAENVYYKYRPFYRSNSDKYYYGNWVAFLTADANVEYEPMVYTYNSPVVSQTEAVLQGVALRGSDEIIEQGFEYWKSGSPSITKINVSGERMIKKVTGLQTGTRYSFRAFVNSGNKTIYGNEVEFVTLANNFDVNQDGEINIADINAVIDIILTDSSGMSGDVNGDGEVNIADINAIIDIILSN